MARFNHRFLFLIFIFPLLGNPLDHASISIYVVNSETKEVYLDQNSDLSLIPASCMKLFTTAAALDLLGPDLRFETTLEYDGTIKEKTLHGNLYIRGGGDPCLGSDRLALSWKEQIALWAHAAENLKLTKIEVKIIGDATAWEKSLAPSSWLWEDLGNYYGAGASALSFHDNSYSLIFKPGNAIDEDVAILRTDIPLPGVILQNEVKTGPKGSGDRACIFGSEYSEKQCIRGTIPLAVEEFTIKGAIPDPAALCAELFAKELNKRKITIESQELPQQKRRTLYTTLSPSVKEIVHEVNQKSINLYAEHLLKRMGEVAYHEGSTASGIRAVIDFCKRQNIDLERFNIVDGSGLSRINLCTAKQLVGLLIQMRKNLIFYESLPQKSELIRAKSGTMSSTKAYAGYAGKIAFAILINHCLDQTALNEKIEHFFLSLPSLDKI
jgi:serine-type D-Ala-D-Ala carboxypeptidase/endopeptidase (penicillin-binding protein 4)